MPHSFHLLLLSLSLSLSDASFLPAVTLPSLSLFSNINWTLLPCSTLRAAGKEKSTMELSSISSLSFTSSLSTNSDLVDIRAPLPTKASSSSSSSSSASASASASASTVEFWYDDDDEDSRRPERFGSKIFLEECWLCKSQLGAGRDAYLCGGVEAFCSDECRREWMEAEVAATTGESFCRRTMTIAAMEEEDQQQQPKLWCSSRTPGEEICKAGTVVAR